MVNALVKLRVLARGTEYEPIACAAMAALVAQMAVAHARPR